MGLEVILKLITLLILSLIADKIKADIYKLSGILSFKQIIPLNMIFFLILQLLKPLKKYLI